VLILRFEVMLESNQRVSHAFEDGANFSGRHVSIFLKLADEDWLIEMMTVVSNHHDLGSISQTFYKQLMIEEIPKVQKDTDDVTVFML